MCHTCPEILKMQQTFVDGFAFCFNDYHYMSFYKGLCDDSRRCCVPHHAGGLQEIPPGRAPRPWRQAQGNKGEELNICRDF